jgi:hypothetical protein
MHNGRKRKSPDDRLSPLFHNLSFPIYHVPLPSFLSYSFPFPVFFIGQLPMCYHSYISYGLLFLGSTTALYYVF